MRRFFIILYIFLLGLTGCSITREIPVQTITKEVVRDSVVFKTDTVEIEIPKEIEKVILPELDTSALETPLAYSEAWLDTAKRMIHHTLVQKPQKIEEEVKIPTKVITRTEYKEKEVPVKVPEPYIPKWVWFLIAGNILFFGYKLLRHF